MNSTIVLFFIYSFLGWFLESIYCTIKEQKWANRGFLYGPICPIYGAGALICLVLHKLIEAGLLPYSSWCAIFILGFVLSMILEYVTSWTLERLFHARWWDYCDMPLNINGRTSVPTSTLFGVVAVVLTEGAIPITLSFLGGVPEWFLNASALILVSVMSVDITLTVSALTDFQKRVEAVDEAIQSQMTDRAYRMLNAPSRLYQKAVGRVSVFKFPTRKLEEARKLREERFAELIRDYMESPEVQKMDEFMQHGDTTTLEHCKSVAYISFTVNERLHLNADEKELVEAAILHDFYLYDWHDGNPIRRTHGFDHPHIASENAARVFDVSERTQDAIRSHMWPLNVFEIPKTKEAVLLCLVDKYCALVETIRGRV